jgi:hypothetical protein
MEDACISGFTSNTTLTNYKLLKGLVKMRQITIRERHNYTYKVTYCRRTKFGWKKKVLPLPLENSRSDGKIKCEPKKHTDLGKEKETIN